MGEPVHSYVESHTRLPDVAI